MQFYPTFGLFSALEEMNLDHDFVQVSKLSEDQKKSSSPKRGHFSPNLGVDQKKRSSPKMEHFYPRIQVDTYAHMHTRVKLLGEMHMQTILKVLGGYSQIIPAGFRHPFSVFPLLLVKIHVLFVCFCSVPSIFSLFLHCLS